MHNSIYHSHQQPSQMSPHLTVTQLESTIRELATQLAYEQDPMRRNGLAGALSESKIKLHNLMVQINGNNNYRGPSQQQHQQSAVAETLFSRGLPLPQQESTSVPDPAVNNRYNRDRYNINDLVQHKQYGSNISDNTVIAPVKKEVIYTPISGHYYKPFVSDDITTTKNILDNSSNYFWELENKDMGMKINKKYFVDYDTVAITTARTGAIASDNKVTSMMLNAKETGSKIALYNTIFTKGIVTGINTEESIYKTLVLNSIDFDDLIDRLTNMRSVYPEMITMLLEYFKDKLVSAFTVFKSNIAIDTIYDCYNIKEQTLKLSLDRKTAIDNAIKHFINNLKKDINIAEDNYPLQEEAGEKFKIINIVESTSMLYVEDEAVINDLYSNALEGNDEAQIITAASHASLYELLFEIFRNDNNYCSEKNELYMIINNKGSVAEVVIAKTITGFLIQY